MIPGVMIDFLERATVGVAASRGRDLIPHIHFLSGWYLEADRETLVCLVAAGFTETLAESLADNGQFAVTLEVIGPHETYQFKGASAGTRPPAETDGPVHLACRQRFFDAIKRYYPDQFTDAAILAHVRPPEIAVRLRVREIFVQTPGPAAGRKLFPRGKR